MIWAVVFGQRDGFAAEFEFAVGDSENIERISAHIEEYVGPVKTVFHEVISDLVHVDVHIVAPSPERDFYTLVTSGMSDRAMTPPPEYPDLKYAELMICLPSDWPMGEEAWKADENYWPVRMLKFLARFPHEYRTWLWAMHTLPHGDPPQPFAANTGMCGIILLPPVTVRPEFQELQVAGGKTIHFHALVPLHADEMDLKLKQGAEALFDGFNRDGISEILEPGRPSTLAQPPAPRRKGWWPFGS